MRILAWLLRFVYHLLYHQFAWSYDLVAALVSLGRWKDWVLAALPRLQGRILELGCGPGHLQAAMRGAGLDCYGLDESRAMLRQAGGRLRRRGHSPRLLRGYAQELPFPDATFDRLVATFPSEYIFDPRTLAEARRLLKPGGELLVLPMAWIRGNRLHERAAARLLHLAGLADSGHLPEWITARLRGGGFEPRTEFQDLPGSRLLFVRAIRSG